MSMVVYLSVLVFVILIVIASYLERKSQLKVKSVNQINFKDNIFKNVLYHIANVFVPPKDWEIYHKYHHFLKYLENVTVEKFFRMKFYIFLVTAILVSLIMMTNVTEQLNVVWQTKDYKMDPIFKNSDRQLSEIQENLIFENEKMYLERLIDSNIDQTIKDGMEKNQVEEIIKMMILAEHNETLTGITADEMANRLYYRVKGFINAREVHPGVYVFVVIFMYMLPEIIIWFYNRFAKIAAEKELKFLKKLIIMNGSIKPVDFMDLLEGLIEKAKYHKTMLEDIQDLNKRNYIDNRDIYKSYIRRANDINLKLFYEKLDEANNYDFDQAILNIKNEFKLEKRVETRNIKKKIESIHILGIVGFMALTLLVIVYMLIPWMTAYDISGFTGGVGI